MSIHRLLMRLFSAFCGGKALNGNVKHFVFDLTCDVTDDPEVIFFKLIWKISSRALHCRLNFSATPIGYRDSREGGRYAPPPPPAEGRGRTRPSRARVNRRWPGGELHGCYYTHWKIINQRLLFAPSSYSFRNAGLNLKTQTALDNTEKFIEGK